MSRKLWMTMGALALFLAAGTARGNDQDECRKDERLLLNHARQSARQEGHSRREAKARAWRQILEARAATAAADWQDAFEDLAHEVLIVAAELSQTGSHKAAMNLLQRVINAAPDADLTQTLERIYERGPRSRSTEAEESDAFEQECNDNGCYGFDFGPALNAWVSTLQEASTPAYAPANVVAGGAPAGYACCVPPCCCPPSAACAQATTDCACGKECKCAQPPACKCGEGCKCKKKTAAHCSPAVRHMTRMAISMAGAPVYAMMACCGTAACCSEAVPCSCTTERCSRVELISNQITQTDNGEVQDVTIIRYDAEGNACQRQYQVMRTLSEDRQACSRTERMNGTTGRLVHHISNDTDGSNVQDMYDFLPCDQD